MKNSYTQFLLLFILPFVSFGQFGYKQYFDGDDTAAFNSIIINYDTTNTNVWQVGPPQKTIFDKASTLPNALITDTINNYPINVNSSFTTGFGPSHSNWGVLALQWNQKLDMDKDFDGGVIEFSLDSGNTWQNVFNNPYVYSFYGFNPTNQDTIVSTGDFSFSGTDNNWMSVWLCFDYSWLSTSDSLAIRFTIKSDSIDNGKEGWVIDNMLLNQTIIHTVNETKQTEYLKVSPTLTSGIVNISSKKVDEYHIIEQMELVDINGKSIREWKSIPTKFFIDISDQKSGIYFLTIKTNFKTETFKIVKN